MYHLTRVFETSALWATNRTSLSKLIFKFGCNLSEASKSTLNYFIFLKQVKYLNTLLKKLIKLHFASMCMEKIPEDPQFLKYWDQPIHDTSKVS